MRRLYHTVSFLVLTSLFPISQATLTVDDKSQIDQMIGQYLENNPEKVFNALIKYKDLEEQKAQENIKNKALEFKDEVFFKKNDLSLGQADAPITIVEFMDYQCGYCKLMNAPLVELLAENPKDYRVVYKPLSFLGPDSKEFAHAAYLANASGKFAEVHKDLITMKRPYTVDDVRKVLKNHSIDVSKMDEQSTKLQSTMELSHRLSVKATPVFFIYDNRNQHLEMISGAMPSHQFKEKIKLLTKK